MSSIACVAGGCMNGITIEIIICQDSQHIGLKEKNVVNVEKKLDFLNK